MRGSQPWTTSGLVLLVVVLLCGCTVEDTSATTETTTTETTASSRPSSLGPFVEYDPEGAIAETYWVGGEPPLPHPLSDQDPRAVLIESPLPGVLRIAVNGGGCVPETRLAVRRGPPHLEIEITLLESVPDPGEQCGLILVSHAFDIVLTAPDAVAGVSLVVVP